MDARRYGFVKVIVASGLSAIWVGCSGNRSSTSDLDVGRASLLLAQVPDDARCLEIVASSPVHSVTGRFDLVPGTSVEKNLQGLPLGDIGFSAVTYALACATVTPGATQTWISDTVIVTLVVGQTVPVKLTLRRPGRATVSIDFSDEPSVADGGSDVSADSDAAPPPTCQIGPFADGDVWDKTYVFDDPNYVAFAVGPGGRLHAGIYRGYAFSDDDGQTWTIRNLQGLISPGQAWPQPAVSADGKSIWLTIRGQGTLVSRDGGSTFSPVPALSGLAAMTSSWVQASPYHAQHLLAYGWREDAFASLVGTLYRSTDGGMTWTNLDSVLARAGGNDAHSATFDPATMDHFWIADMPQGVFETNDGGGAFAAVPGSDHSFISTVTRTSDGTNPRLVVTGACSAPTSTVIGQNVWQSSTGDSPHCCPEPRVVADPFDLASAVLFQCHDLDPTNLRYSTNGGVTLSVATWPAALDDANMNPPLTVRSLIVDPHRPRTFYAAHSNQWSVLKSTDGGKTWVAVGGLPGRGC